MSSASFVSNFVNHRSHNPTRRLRSHPTISASGIGGALSKWSSRDIKISSGAVASSAVVLNNVAAAQVRAGWGPVTARRECTAHLGEVEHDQVQQVREHHHPSHQPYLRSSPYELNSRECQNQSTVFASSYNPRSGRGPSTRSAARGERSVIVH